MIIFTKKIILNSKSIIYNLKNIHKITLRCNFSNFRNQLGFFDGMKKKNVKLKLRDKISDDYDLIYRTNFDNYVYSARLFGILTTAIVTPIIFYVDYYSPSGITKVPIKPDVEGFLQSGEMDMFIYTASLLIFNLMLIITSGRFPLRIYRHTQKSNYIALLPTYVPFKTKQMQFIGGDLKPVPLTGITILPWASARHMLGDQKTYIFEHCFRTANEYQTIIESQ